MRNWKTCLFAALVLAVLGGSVAITGVTGPSAVAEPPAVHNHWRYHDGHWGYWYEPDHRWYYTDGTNWYYSGDDGAWNTYRFDRKFGREEFERGDYRVPEAGAKIEVPRHHAYRGR